MNSPEEPCNANIEVMLRKAVISVQLLTPPRSHNVLKFDVEFTNNERIIGRIIFMNISALTDGDRRNDERVAIKQSRRFR